MYTFTCKIPFNSKSLDLELVLKFIEITKKKLKLWCNKNLNLFQVYFLSKTYKKESIKTAKKTEKKRERGGNGKTHVIQETERKK